MNNGEYWQNRFELLEQAAHQQGVQCYADIEKQYRQAQKQLEGQIAAWYQRFASNNGVTLAEAKRMLNAKELAELKWDVNQYIQYGQEMRSTALGSSSLKTHLQDSISADLKP